MKTQELIEKVNTLINPVIESMGFDLIETEYLNENSRWILRLYIDVDSRGITLDDCKSVSRSVSAILDVEDVVPGKYNLEVSSPGSPRPVRRPEDFQKFSGSMVKIRTHNKVDERRNFKGVLQGFDEGFVKVNVEDREFKIPIEEILKARIIEENLSGGK